MSYEVLARKWRPHSFDTMVGQQHVVQALVNALEQQRLHHAYLFTGTRGVGKTTVARIIAKCLNCEAGITSKPCGECDACQEIDAGRFIDLLEVDAASRTKVEDTRELLDNVQYAPSKGRYKVYLIDEVHMLSGHSFNALLKTLEEPPPHVKFLLATTDPQKLPATVLSRCLQFHLKNLNVEQISAHLAYVLEQEQLAFEAPALSRLARAANGSMRDALSLLDQAIAFGDGKVSANETMEMLGAIDSKHVLQLMQALVSEKPDELMSTIQSLAEYGADFAGVLEELLSLLHQISVLQAIPNAKSELWDDCETASQLAKNLTAEQVQLFYQIALIGRRDLSLAPTPRIGLEMVLLRMLAFAPVQVGNNTPFTSQSSALPPQAGVALKGASPAPPQSLRHSSPQKGGSGLTAPKKPSHSRQEVAGKTMPPLAGKAPSGSEAKGATMRSTNPSSDWHTIITELNLRGVSQAVAENCTLTLLDDNEIHLSLGKSHAAMLNDNLKKRLEQTLNEYFGKPRRLTINIASAVQDSPAAKQQAATEKRQQHAQHSISQDQNVQAIIDAFDATIIPDSTKPLDN